MSDRGARVVYEFGSFRADPLTRRLLAGRDCVPLAPKAFETLLILLANRGEVVAKSELMDAIWADTAVEENNLTQQISALRKALGERAGEHRFIVTLPGRGYSFVAPVSEVRFDEIEELVVTEVTRSSITVDISRAESGYLPAWLDRGRFFGTAIGAAYILLVCMLAVWPMFSPTPVRSMPQTVAVLPFRSTASGDESLGAGIRDTLRARLGNLDDVTVRPASPAEAPDNAVIAGREMHADVVFSGSIQQEADRIRVAVELIDVNDERVVWGRTFDCDRSRFFELQDAIAVEAVRVIKSPFRRNV